MLFLNNILVIATPIADDPGCQTI